MGGELDRKRDW